MLHNGDIDRTLRGCSELYQQMEFLNTHLLAPYRRIANDFIPYSGRAVHLLVRGGDHSVPCYVGTPSGSGSGGIREIEP